MALCVAITEPMVAPMPAKFDGYIEVLARVSSTCLVTVQRNRYSVPCHLANQQVAIHLYPDRIEISAENAIVACHTRLLDRDQVSYDWQHYIPLIKQKPGALRNGAPFADMPIPFAILQAALRRRERQQGDRVMAKVLAAIPVHGLEAVLIAVELVLESEAPSVEHVMNVLARLNQTPPPEQVETSLKLAEEPLACQTPVNWHIAMRPGKRRALDRSSLGEMMDKLEQAKASIHSTW